MDSYRDFPSEFETAAEIDTAAETSASAIGTDERRMHVRAYNHWVSLLSGRDYPSIEDLEPGDLVDFAEHSVLLDFTANRDNPALPYVGAAIREECGIEDEIQSIADVPSRSLLSRLTDHYMQIIANRAPVGFEAEFVNQRGESLCYRGILMPFSSDGETIDFIYGVINWKVLQSGSDSPADAPEDSATLQPAEDEIPLELTSPLAPEETHGDPAAADGLGDNAGLADRLWAARECAEAAREADSRSRAALYRALSTAYDFALAAVETPQDYAELLEESGVSASPRSPMTAVAKLVFGIQCDKARLTEYAAALSCARREQVEPGGFLDFIEARQGGLKALVAAEREARRPQGKPDTKTENARRRLRSADPVSIADFAGDEEFVLVLARRSSGGVHEPIAVIGDPALVERAIRTAAS